MGSGQWGSKELDMTEGPWHTCTQAPGVDTFHDEAGGPLDCAPSWGQGWAGLASGWQESHPNTQRVDPRQWCPGGQGVGLSISVPQGWAQRASSRYKKKLNVK